LSIVKSIVELHGGNISVLSEYEKGTGFIIVLPIIALHEENSICRAFETDLQESGYLFFKLNRLANAIRKEMQFFSQEIDIVKLQYA